MRCNTATVQLNQMTHNCESETEPAFRPRFDPILPEAFKYMWQKRGLDAAARVAHGEFDLGTNSAGSDSDMSTIRRELLADERCENLRSRISEISHLSLPYQIFLVESSGMKEFLCEFRSACVEHCDDSQKQKR